jgi:large subunit ribosomal protein L35
MPKMKTNRGAAKRFRKTKNGKIKRKKAFAGHFFTRKTRKRKRKLRKATTAARVDTARITRLIPYV